ncbi:hypothetical protein ACWGQT_07405 [Streptomyces yangpuensis]
MTVSIHARCHEVETLDDGTTLHCDRSKGHTKYTSPSRRFHWDVSHDRRFGPAVVTVDMITPTKGSVGILTVDGTTHGGWIFNDAARHGGTGWSAATEATDEQEEKEVAREKNTARNATIALARAFGITGPLAIEIVREYKTTGERD